MTTVTKRMKVVGTLLIASATTIGHAQESEGVVIGEDGVRIGSGIEISRDGVRVGDVRVGSRANVGDADAGAVWGDDIHGGNYQGQNFSGYRFVGIDINGADFTGADFSGAEFSGVDFENTILVDANFTDAEFGSVDFNNVDMRRACFLRAKVVASDFNGGDMSDAYLVDAKMVNNDIYGTRQDGVVRTGEPVCPGFESITTAAEIEQQLGGDAGSEIALRVNFETNSDQIRAEALAQVYEIAKALQTEALTGVRIRIEGHTDSDGDREHNVDLSYRRALAVARDLSENHGISNSRFEIKGYGEDRPLADNDSAAGKAQNRRVVLVNLGPR